MPDPEARSEVDPPGGLVGRERDGNGGRVLPAAACRQALDAAQMAIWEWSADDGVAWEGDVEALTGRPSEELVDLTACEVLGSLVDPGDRDDLAARCRSSLESSDVLDLEFRCPRPSSEAWLAIRGEVRRDQSMQPIRALGVIMDVTEPRLAEERLRESERQLRHRAGQERAVAELGLMALRGGPLDDLHDQATQVLAQVLGVELTEILALQPGGRQLLLRAGVGWREGQVGHVTVGADPESQAGYILASEGPVVVEHLPAETRFRVPAPLLDHGVVSGMSVVIDGRDTPFGIVGAYATHRQRFSDDDVAFLRAVARVVATAVERSRVEAESRRVEAEVQRSRALESFGRLAGGIAHDFNNLLTPILGYGDEIAQALGSRLTPDEAGVQGILADLGEIRRSAERGAALTRQLLTFARRDAIRPELVDLNRLIDDLEGVLHHTLGEDLVLCIERGPGVWLVLTDPGQFEEVLVNLVVNARDAMPGGGTLTIATANAELDEAYCRLHPGASAGPYVRLSVSDTGSGMMPEVAVRAFEPFFTTKPPGKLTGVGLTTVHAIVSRAGGSVTLYSQPGVGTTVHVYLPAQVTGVVPPREREEAPARRESPARALAGRTVLVVEDEDALRAVACRMLSKIGCRVLEAGRPSDAVTICETEEGSIDLLLTDVVMPEMSGPELAQRVEELRPETRVLYMSGYPADFTSRKQVLLAPDIFVEKPFTRAVLLAAVARVLGAPGAGGEVRGPDSES